MEPTRSGCAGSPITYDAYGTGALPIISGGGTNQLAIGINGPQYLLFQNIKFTGATGDNIAVFQTSNLVFNAIVSTGAGAVGLNMEGSTACNNITVEYSSLFANANGDILDACQPGDNIQIIGNICHDSVTNTNPFQAGIRVVSDGVGSDPQTNVYTLNNITYNEGIGSGGAANNTGNGIHLDTVRSAVVSGNVSYNNAQFGIDMEQAGTTGTHIVAHNITYGNTTAGIILYRRSWGVQINNNISYSNGTNLLIEGEVGGDAIRMMNNVVTANTLATPVTSQFVASNGANNDTTNGSGNTYLNNCFGANGSNYFFWGATGYSTVSAFIAATSGAASNSCASGATYYLAPALAGWTLLNHTQVSTSQCNTSDNKCTLPIPSTGGGNILRLGLTTFLSSTQVKISSVTDNASGTWTLCPTSLCAGHAGDVSADQAFNLASTAGATSVTANLSATVPFGSSMAVDEWSPPPGSTVSYDVGNNAGNASCTTCTFPTLTLTGSNDLINIVGYGEVTTSGLTGCFALNSHYVPSSNTQQIQAYCTNASSYTAPTLTLNTANAFAGSALALKAVGAAATPSGNDSNSGTSVAAPWLTPNHALNCGDQIVAIPSLLYAGTSFQTWGTVTCSAGSNVAWLPCLAFDACKINASASAMTVDQSYWGVQGWEATTDSNGGGGCFNAAPSGASTIHHIVFANDVANGCSGSGFQAYNPSNTKSVDYFNVIGSIAYNAAQGSNLCFSGINIYQPIAVDSVSGTHIFFAGNFSYHNIEPNPCNGGTPTDGEGIIFDTLNGCQGSLASPYSQQVVAENNLVFYNGAQGISSSGGCGTDASRTAPIYFVHNTVYNSSLSPTGFTDCGDITSSESSKVTATYNLAVAPSGTGCGTQQVYALSVTFGDATVNFDHNWAYSVTGNNTVAYMSPGFSYGVANILGMNPGLMNPGDPGAPNCTLFSSVTACMASVIANYTPTVSAAQTYGYQLPSVASVLDPLFPNWLCTANIPSGLVSMGCLSQSSTGSNIKILGNSKLE